MKVAKSYQMKNIDRYAIEEIGIPGLILMENAANAVALAVKARPEALKGVAVMCGVGNNGGDGFAIARQLSVSGLKVFIYVFGQKSSITDDAEVNYNIADRLGISISFISGVNINELTVKLKHCGVIVDAVFGTGLSRDIDDFCGMVFEAVNASGAYVVSVDIPSGVMGDTGRLCSSSIRADETVSFQLPKVGNIMYPGAECNGKLKVVNIGIPDEAVSSQQIMCEATELSDVKQAIYRRRPDTHKGTYGRIGILAGSVGMAGASVLNSRAALRCGSGLVRVCVPKRIYDIVEASVTEAMVYGFDTAEGTYEEAVKGLLSFSDVVATGSGCTNMDNYDEILKLLIKNSDKPVIIDAEGINSVARFPEILQDRKSPAIVLTPHYGEMARLTGRKVSDVAACPIDIALDYAVKMNVYMVLKGARTVTATPKGYVYINTTGNAGMATAGSGDVLTGMIASIMGQCDDTALAIKTAVYMHGLAGDAGAARLGQHSLTAGDLIDAIPNAYKIITGE